MDPQEEKEVTTLVDVKEGPPNETNLGGMEKQLNIILVGESGVGKTTWINAMHDFFTYSHLEDAAAAKSDRSEWSPLIPFQFHMTNERYEEVVMRIDGQSSWSNETYVPGQAPCTQTPMTYEFQLGVTGGLLRLIDTPGITDGTTLGDNGDTNFIQLLAHLRSTVQEIHAILIFLKPNEARLTPTLKFLIQQLLLNWPRSVIPNLIFTFTHTRGTLYRPGESLSALSTFLSRSKVPITLNRSTMYCFDNECLQFLASKRHGTEYSEDHFDMYRSSWSSSRDEGLRLLDYVMDLPSFDTKEVGTIQLTRRLLELLQTRISPLGSLIEENDGQIERIKDNLNEVMNEDKGEKSQGQFQAWGPRQVVVNKKFLVKKLETVSVVCNSPKCTQLPYKRAGIGDLGKFSTVRLSPPMFPDRHYASVCHANCKVVWARFFGWTCGCFDWSFRCTKCKCPLSQHVWTMYETVLEKEEEESIAELKTKIKAPLAASASIPERNEAILEYAQNYTSQLTEELHQILEVGAILASFLEKNVMIPSPSSSANDPFALVIAGLVRKTLEDEDEEAAKKNGGHSELGGKDEEFYLEKEPFHLTNPWAIETVYRDFKASKNNFGKNIKDSGHVTQVMERLYKYEQLGESVQCHVEKVLEDHNALATVEEAKVFKIQISTGATNFFQKWDTTEA